MHRQVWITSLLLFVFAICLAEENATPPTPPSAGPAKSKPAADLLTGTIDPFHEGLERRKFINAAGVDMELSKKEFELDSKRDDGFARKYDRWNTLIQFDKNVNESLDWFEITSYLQTVRFYVFEKFDVDGNLRLIGKERELANKDLEGGYKGQEATMEDVLMKYDSDRDGKLTPEEYEKGVVEWKKVFDARYKARELERWDANNDGVIDDREREFVMEREYQESKTQILSHYDSDQNGQLSTSELQAYRQKREHYDRLSFDQDGDGALNSDQLRAYRESERGQYWADFDKFDSRPDGVHDVEERKAFWAHSKMKITTDIIEPRSPNLK